MSTLFNLGEIYATQGALDAHTAETLAECIKKHACGKWGDLCEEDKQANEDALKRGARILSRYNLDGGAVYVITEWDRSVTTVLLACEY